MTGTWKITDAKMWSLGYFTTPPPKGPYGYWRPSEWDQTLEAWLHERLRYYDEFHVRDPGHAWSMAGTRWRTEAQHPASQWHMDGCAGRYLGTWSNNIGTEIRKEYGRTIYQPEPQEFVLFDNRYFEHRPPTGTRLQQRNKRWFVRLTTNGPIKDHPDVKECTL